MYVRFIPQTADKQFTASLHPRGDTQIQLQGVTGAIRLHKTTLDEVEDKDKAMQRQEGLSCNCWLVRKVSAIKKSRHAGILER